MSIRLNTVIADFRRWFSSSALKGALLLVILPSLLLVTVIVSCSALVREPPTPTDQYGTQVSIGILGGGNFPYLKKDGRSFRMICPFAGPKKRRGCFQHRIFDLEGTRITVRHDPPRKFGTSFIVVRDVLDANGQSLIRSIWMQNCTADHIC